MIPRKAYQALQSYQHIDNHAVLSPRQIAYLCVFALGQALETKAVSERFGRSYSAASNHIYVLREGGYIQKARIKGHQITKKGINVIQELFPHTYVIEQ
tara:strand:+ start:6285 stop:6581 length:297 start_codon:yes stop_codon:yes gene_type:complete